MKLYTIHDAKAEFYNQPFFARSNGEALRTFQRLVNDTDQNNMISASPSDFTLCAIGVFNDQTGELVGVSAPVTITNGKDVKIHEQAA